MQTSLPQAKQCVLLCVVMLLGVTSWAQKRVHHLGPPSSQSFSAPVRTQADVIAMLTSNVSDVATVLRSSNSGLPDISADLVSAAGSSVLTEISIQTGTEHPWMAMRSHGNATAAGPWIWAGKSPFKAWTYQFQSHGKTWTIVIPEPCGNFWVTGEQVDDHVVEVKGNVEIKGDLKIKGEGIAIEGGPVTLSSKDVTITATAITINANAITINGPVTSPLDCSCTQRCCHSFKLFWFIPIGSSCGGSGQQQQQGQAQGKGRGKKKRQQSCCCCS